MDKAESFIQSLLKFVKSFQNTYVMALSRSGRLFSDICRNKPSDDLMNSGIFLLISTFLLIYSVNIVLMTDIRFQLISTSSLPEMISILLDVEAKQLVVVTLPVALFVYISTRLVSVISKKHGIGQILIYWLSSCFISYFLAFTFLVISSKSIFFINNNIVVFNPAFVKVITAIIWILIFLFWGYVIVIPMVHIQKIIFRFIKQKYIIASVWTILIIVVFTCIIIGRKQKNFDKVFNPLKEYALVYKFPSMLGNKFDLHFKEVGISSGGNRKLDSVKIINKVYASPEIEAENPIEPKFQVSLDFVITNNTPYMEILRPDTCFKLLIDYDEYFKEIINEENRVCVSLCLKNITDEMTDNYTSFNNTKIQNDLLILPGETQWLNLTGNINMYNYLILSDLYASAKPLAMKLQINKKINNNKTYNTTTSDSEIISVSFSSFKPSRNIIESYKNFRYKSKPDSLN